MTKVITGMRRSLAACLALACLALLAPGCKKRVEGAVGAKARTRTAEQIYADGMALLKRRKYFRARSTLDKALSKPGVTRELVADVNLALADAYFYDGGIINIAEALSRYTSFLTFYPTHPRADYAQYQLGLSYLKQALGPDKDQDTTRKALEEFRKVVLTHPDSEWAVKAREQMDECRERLAESEMLVGVFYHKRDAYAGAIQRFKELLEKYPGFSQRDRVFFELAESLKATRKTEEALAYLRKIVEEFPDSRYHDRARSAIEEYSGAEDAGERTADAKGDRSARERKGEETAPSGDK